MIVFQNDHNQIIELSTENYQFPNSDAKDYDGNWLKINIKVIEDKKEWNRTDPFLLTYDWMAISKWFEDISNFINPKWKELGFIEPNIEFQLIDFNKEKDQIELYIQLKLECIPDYHKGKNQIKYCFKYNSKECKLISEKCKSEYNRFPERK